VADGYTVTSVNQSQDLAAGKLRDVVTATFELDNEAGSGTATVPMEGAWQEALAAELERQTSGMIAILSL
jgi:hypothetical protein